MEDYIEFYNRRFDFKKQIGKLRVFQSSDDTVHNSFTIGSDEVKIYKNDCVFILDSEKEEIIRYSFNRKGTIDEKTAYKFIMSTGSLKKWGGHSSQDLNLNRYGFCSEAKNEEEMYEENITYYIQYSPEELKVFVNNIFKNLKTPCFEMTTIIRFFRDGRKTDDKEKIKSNIYKYVLLPNKKYDNFEMPEKSKRKHIKIIKTKDAIIFEDHTKYYPPKEYLLDAKERFKQNLDCYRVYWGTPFYEEYLKAKNKLSIKLLSLKSSKLTFKEFLLKNQNKKFRKSRQYAEEHAYVTFQKEYEKNKQINTDDQKVKELTKKEYIEELEKRYILHNTYNELKKWIEKVKIEEPRGYGLTIGTYAESSIKRYFSINARGHYFYKDIVIKFSLDGYGKDFIYEFKTCIVRRVEHNLKFAKEQANLYAYLTGKKRIIIEIFSYEEDKIHYYEYSIDIKKAKEQLEKFYEGYKSYIKSLE